MDYATLKLIHQGCAALSVAGFAARGAGMVLDAAWVRTRLARTLPHGVDTVLLLAALAMVAQRGTELLGQPWLQLKLAGLLAYIGLGMLALRPGRPKAVRVAAWLAAMAVFAGIVASAWAKPSIGG